MSDPELFTVTSDDDEINPMRMEQIEVFINKAGTISIKQDCSDDAIYLNTQIITINPLQVPLLCEWLKKLIEENEND